MSKSLCFIPFFSRTVDQQIKQHRREWCEGGRNGNFEVLETQKSRHRPEVKSLALHNDLIVMFYFYLCSHDGLTDQT